LSSATFDLIHAARAADELDHARRLAAGDLASSARVAATMSLLALAEALGLDESERALVQALVFAADGNGPLSPYDLAHLRGQVVTEVNGEERLMSLAELRKLIRKAATCRL
jgi:hypothetical protein